MRASRSDFLIDSSRVVLTAEQPLKDSVFPSLAPLVRLGVDGSPTSPEKFALASAYGVRNF